MGRPRKPAAARAREGGTAKQGAVSHRPQPATELVVIAGRNVPVTPPEDLPTFARDLWVEIVKVLADAGVVDRVDLPALRLFCVSYARAMQAREVLDAPVDDDDVELARRLEDTKAVLHAQKVRVAALLEANVDVPPAKLNAIANLETTVANLEAYLRARERVGNLIALGSTGQLTEHPLLQTERQAQQLVLRFASRFGLTPADRASLGLALLEGHSRQRELVDVLGESPRSRSSSSTTARKRSTTKGKK